MTLDSLLSTTEQLVVFLVPFHVFTRVRVRVRVICIMEENEFMTDAYLHDKHSGHCSEFLYHPRIEI